MYNLLQTEELLTQINTILDLKISFFPIIILILQTIAEVNYTTVRFKNTSTPVYLNFLAFLSPCIDTYCQKIK